VSDGREPLEAEAEAEAEANPKPEPQPQPRPPLTPASPDGWPRGSGYAHGTSGHGRVICTAGQIGWNPLTQRLVSAGFAAQVEQALENVAAVLRAAGARPAHTARLTWYITDRAAYLGAAREIGAAYRRIFGNHYPAMSVVVVAGLLEEGAMVEIEATAIVPA
jgi:enamine deaminase RidA (YjgF/YER057c/UK114 family)